MWETALDKSRSASCIARPENLQSVGSSLLKLERPQSRDGPSFALINTGAKKSSCQTGAELEKKDISKFQKQRSTSMSSKPITEEEKLVEGTQSGQALKCSISLRPQQSPRGGGGSDKACIARVWPHWTTSQLLCPQNSRDESTRTHSVW